MKKTFISCLIMLLAVVTFTSITLAGEVTTLTFWTGETDPWEMDRQNEIARDFEKLNPGIKVEVVPVTYGDFPIRIMSAAAAGTLPDVAMIYTDLFMGWAAEGIVDTVTTTSVINDLGSDTFFEGALNAVRLGEEYAAVPSSGWGQLLLYRKDLFEEKGLAVPETWDAILTAAKTLHNPPLMWGFSLGTDPGQPYTMEIIEALALSNNARLVDAEGNVNLNTPEFIRTIQFYKQLAEYSPSGLNYWVHTRLDYLGGRTPMVFWSPYILDELAGLRSDLPVLPGLNEKTGIVTAIKGPDGPKEGAQYGRLSSLGIFVGADIDAAKRFIKFLLTEDYLKLLSLAPEGNFPVRSEFLAGWETLEIGRDIKKKISDVYPPEVTQLLAKGMEELDRWGYGTGKSSLVGKIYNTLVIPKALKLYMDNEITATKAVEMMTSRIREMERE